MTGRAALETAAMRTGADSAFEVHVPGVTNVARYRVGFRQADGTVVAHVDRRGQFPEGIERNRSSGPSRSVLPVACDEHGPQNHVGCVFRVDLTKNTPDVFSIVVAVIALTVALQRPGTARGRGVFVPDRRRTDQCDGHGDRRAGAVRAGAHGRATFESTRTESSRRSSSSTTKRVPVSLGIALDTSGSMIGEKMAAAEAALNRFVFDLLGDQDEMFLYRFDSRPELVQGWTENRQAIRKALGVDQAEWRHGHLRHGR